MSNVVTFTGGRRCVDCDEQISPLRLRAKPDARTCVNCQCNRDRVVAATMRMIDRMTPAARERCSVTIKW